MHLPADESDMLGAIELALAATLASEPIEARIREALKAGRLGGASAAERGAAAVDAGVITADERALLQRAGELSDRVIRVDDFPQDLGASELKPPTALAPTGAARKVAAA
jgi:acyl-CoA dehydrogenase